MIFALFRISGIFSEVFGLGRYWMFVQHLTMAVMYRWLMGYPDFQLNMVPGGVQYTYSYKLKDDTSSRNDR